MALTSPVGYLIAIRRALHDEDIPVLGHSFTAGPPRTATLRLNPAWPKSSLTGLESLELEWGETTGWRLIMTYPATTGLHPAPVYAGLLIVPEPPVLAAWVALALTHPELTATQPNTHGETPVDTALRRYAPVPR